MQPTRPSAPSSQPSTALSPSGGANVPPPASLAQSPDGVTLQPDLFDPLAALLHAHAATFRPGFELWLRDNGPVWRSFKREADRIWRRGRTHYSARTIIEHLRHESAITSNDVEFKLNNNVAPDLARLYRLAHPERAALFETRVMPGSERAA